MERLCIDSKVLGTKDHLVVDDGAFWWTARVPEEAWHLDGRPKDDSDRCLDTVLRLKGCNVDMSPPRPFVREMEQLSGSLGSLPVPWQKVMPSRAHLGFVKRLVNDVVVATDGAPFDYYKKVWTPGNAVFRSLQQVAIDRPTWERLIKEGTGNVPAVRSFEPGPDGLAQKVEYDRFKTLTGRLTVDSGPQILTLKREHRSMMRSVYGEEGDVYSLDFAALEARILLYEYNRKCDEVDLYGMLAKELGYDRKAIKGAVIAKLYGMKDWALAKHLGIDGKEFHTFLEKFNVHFNTQDLLARVKAQFVATGKVINHYGRPVTIDEPVDNIFVSYYGQSTGVDVTMLGFDKVVKAIRGKRIRPVFLLHDAILFDCHKDDLSILEAITHVKVPGYVQKFPFKFEQIS